LYRDPGFSLAARRGAANRGNTASCALPIECRTRIRFASGRNITVTYQPVRRQSRVGVTEGGHDVRKALVLDGFVRQAVGPFELHTDRKIIASGAAIVVRLTRVPGAISEFDKLRQFAVARHQKVRRDPQFSDLGKIRVHMGRQRIREQPFDPGSAEFPRRQADAVHDDQLRLHAGRTRIEVWRGDLPGALHQPAFEVNLHAVSICDNCAHMNATRSHERIPCA
jgi:hypothetical protein